ncbi:MAG: hypothetical protein HYR72_08450 [Deltaproteobacteria bacterium]|nr:hypothetical protein [Deltaproteobacteria bacterium]MBI3388783.1 hypothetical protein [Deltaproteobacteria bacterium]
MTSPTLDLRSAFAAIANTLSEEKIAHAFIGALPVLAWGRVRATTDIDVVVVVEDNWERLSAALKALGVEQHKQIGPADETDSLPDVAVFYTSGDSPVRIDVFIAKTQFEQAVVATARHATALDVSVRLARPEASIIYKLLAQRRRDLDDIDGIFEARRIANDPLDWRFLEHWSAEWGIEDRLAPYRVRYGPSE